jgi:hypothetical protein
MAAAVGISFWRITGSAAAGIAEFLWRRAGIPVAGCTRAVPVPLTARAGVPGGGFFFSIPDIVRCFLGIFWHLFTNRTVAVL